jgi:regulatory protein
MQDRVEREKKIRITKIDVAYKKAETYCAYQERCQQEVRNKLYEWGLWPDAVEKIIAQLITENFLNEERFAKAYAGGKFRIKKWGRLKIKIELKKRRITDYCLKAAMSEIDDDDYTAALKQIIEKRLSQLKGKKQLQFQNAARYAISRGYEGDLVWDLIKTLQSKS